MKKNEKGFGAHLLLITLALVATISLIGWRVLHSQKNTTSSNSTELVTPKFTSNIDAGFHSLDLKTSDVILMPSGAILSLPEIDAYSIPQFSYDNTYSSKSKKFLPINSQLEAYHNGYKYKVTKGVCNKAEKSFDDYTQVVVTDCKVAVDVQKSNLPKLDSVNINKQYIVTEKNNPGSGPQAVLSLDPFLMARGGDGRLTYPINNGKPYLEANDGSSVSLTVVSDYGVSRVTYSVDEFTAKLEKQINIDNSIIKIRPSSITCTPAYLENSKCVIVNDKFIFDINYSRQQASTPEIVIYNLN